MPKTVGKEKKGIRSRLLQIVVLLSVLALSISMAVLLVRVNRFSDQVEESFNKMLIAQATSAAEDQLSQARQVVDRLCGQQDLGYYLGQDRAISARQWIIDTVYHYGIENTPITDIIAVSAYKQTMVSMYAYAHAGKTYDIPTFEELLGTSLYAASHNNVGRCILVAGEGIEKTELDNLLGEYACSFYLFRSIEDPKIGTVVILALIGEDRLRDNLPSNIDIWYMDGAFYASGTIKSETMKASRLLAYMIVSAVITLVLIIAIFFAVSRRLTKPAEALKEALEHYEVSEGKERYNWHVTRRRRKTLREAMMLVTIFSIMPPMLLFFLGANNVIRQWAENAERQTNEKQCEQVFSGIDTLLNNEFLLLRGLGYDARMQMALGTRDTDLTIEVVSDYSYLYMVEDDICIYDAEGELIFSTDAIKKNVLSGQEIEALKAEIGGEVWLMDHQLLDQSDSIRFMHWVGDLETRKLLGVLQTEVRALELRNCWVGADISSVEIKDGKGEVVYSFVSSLKGDSVYKDFKWKQPLSERIWVVTIGCVLPNSPLFIAECTGLEILMSLLLVLGILFSIWIISEKLLNAFLRIEKVTERTYTGVDESAWETVSASFPEDLEITEFAELGHSFNEMAGRIETLLDDIMVITEKDAELRIETERAGMTALQTQINPHFLYNTLESINSVIVRGDNEKAERMITILGRFFRYSADQKQIMVPLHEDLDMLREYLELMDLRTGDRVHCEIEIPEELQVIQVIKLLLQPVVENVYLHGLKEEPCRIRITGKKEDGDLILCVEDNGRGIPKEEVPKLNERLRSPDGSERIGLANVNARLRLRFGTAYGVSVTSFENRGTCVMLRMPVANIE